MAATGYTPIQLYYSTTASAVPTAGNLASGELAINITDGKLYYKNNAGTVTLLAGATSGPAGGSNTQVQFNSSGVLAGSSNLTWDGTTFAVTGRLYNGSASSFGSSTWAMSLGNGGASANYFKGDTTYFQNGSGTQIAQLDSTGFGVGTAATYKLDVSSSAEVVSRFARSGGSNALITISDPTTTTAPYIASYGNNMAFGQYGGSEFGRFTSTGLGIGTSSPSWPLTVKSASSGTVATFLYDGSFAGTGEANIGLRFYNGGSASDIPQVKLRAYGTSNYTGNFAVNVMQGGTYPNPFVERLTVQGTTGYVGIGATSPSTNLVIGGTAASGGAGGGLGVFLSRGNTTNFFEAFDGTKSFIGGCDDSQGYAKVGTLSQHPVALVAGNGNGFLYLTTSSNLSIGTTTSYNSFNLPQASGGYGITWDRYGNVFGEYSTGATVISSNYYPTQNASGYKTALTASYGAAGISVSGTGGSGNGGLIAFYVDPATSKTSGNAFTPTECARIDSSGRLLVGTTSISGSSSNYQPVIAGAFRSFSGSVSMATNTYTTLFTAPSAFGSYMVTVWINADDCINYQANIIVNTQPNGSAKLNVIVSANLFGFQMSGYNVQVAQNSGGTATVNYQAMRIGG